MGTSTAVRLLFERPDSLTRATRFARSPGLDNLDWYSVLGNHDYGSALGYCANKTTLEACAASGGKAEYQIGQKRNEAANATYYLEENYVKRFGDGLLDICFVDTNPIVLTYREKITEFNLANGLPVPDWQANVDQLEACLANSTATVKFVVAHESPYSNGADHSGYPELRPIFGPLFEKYGVDIFFAGHSHNQEHLVVRTWTSPAVRPPPCLAHAHARAHAPRCSISGARGIPRRDIRFGRRI